MGTHDILVYDDDESLRGNLAVRCVIVRDALSRLRATHAGREPIDTMARGAEVQGFDTREGLLTAIEARNKSEWAIALVDLQDADGSMRGARIMRTIREHPELAGRCMPAALTVHANPAMQRALHQWAFTLIAMASVGSAPRLTEAMAEMYGRHPSEQVPGCSSFPEADEPGASPVFAENFDRWFGVRPRFGDDLVVRHVDRGIPDTVTDRRLRAASANSRGQWRRSVEDFKKEIALANGWERASVAPRVRAFVGEMVRLDFEDPINPREINTAAALWRDAAARTRARIPNQHCPTVDAFFLRFRAHLDSSAGSLQNAAIHEKALHAACADVVESHRVSVDWIHHVLHVLLDLARAPSGSSRTFSADPTNRPG